MTKYLGDSENKEHTLQIGLHDKIGSINMVTTTPDQEAIQRDQLRLLPQPKLLHTGCSTQAMRGSIGAEATQQ
eukprot:5508586-Amphidinium_carterae.1